MSEKQPKESQRKNKQGNKGKRGTEKWTKRDRKKRRMEIELKWMIDEETELKRQKNERRNAWKQKTQKRKKGKRIEKIEWTEEGTKEWRDTTGRSSWLKQGLPQSSYCYGCDSVHTCVRLQRPAVWARGEFRTCGKTRPTVDQTGHYSVAEVGSRGPKCGPRDLYLYVPLFARATHVIRWLGEGY